MTAGTVTELPPRPRRPRRPRVSVVIPTYNEARNLPHVFALLPADVHEVILVDGRSVDDTIEVARFLRPDVVVVEQNRIGKGNAMACGFAAVTGDVVVMLDADGSADPREIQAYVDALVAGADFAKGTRFAEGGGSADITPMRAWGNRWLNRIANLLFGTRYTDLCYGYNAFWAHCLPALELDPRDRPRTTKLWGDGFEIETLINTRIAKAGFAITEVPSYEAERIHGQSNLNTWRDGFRVLRALIVERFNDKGRDMEIVRPVRDVAPARPVSAADGDIGSTLAEVVDLPYAFVGNRIIQPVDAAPGTRLPAHGTRLPAHGTRLPAHGDPAGLTGTVGYDPGPLARALMAMSAADSR